MNKLFRSLVKVYQQYKPEIRKQIGKIREDTHKKKVWTTKVLPSLHQWISGPSHFFLVVRPLKNTSLSSKQAGVYNEYWIQYIVSYDVFPFLNSFLEIKPF